MIELLLCLVFGVDCEPTEAEIIIDLINHCNSINGTWNNENRACDKSMFIIKFESDESHPFNTNDHCTFNNDTKICWKFEWGD